MEYIQNAIENVSKSDNILFYSNQQMAVLNSNDARYDKLMIRGPFGSGKTMLLQQKAIQINEQPRYKGKVMYLVGLYERKNAKSRYPLLFHRMKHDLEENLGIFVFEITNCYYAVSIFSMRNVFLKYNIFQILKFSRVVSV